jgi:hypothetical protein
MKSSDGDKDYGSGINTSIGRVFSLGQGFETTSMVTGNVLSLDFDQNSNVKYISYNIGLAQRAGYKIEMGNMILKPFIGIEVLTGTISGTDTETNRGDRTETNIKMNYYQYGASLGAKLILSNGIAPFVRYKVSNTIVSEQITVNVKENDRNIGTSTTNWDLTKKERTLNNTSFIVGLSYLF